MLPLRLPREPLASDGRPVAVLLARLPLACVGPAVGPQQLALTMFLAIAELALVLPAIGPLHDAFGAHVVLLPLTSVRAAIAPRVRALAVHVVAVELALVAPAGGPNKLAPAVTVPTPELALEDGPVCEAFHALLEILVQTSFCEAAVLVPELLQLFLLVRREHMLLPVCGRAVVAATEVAAALAGGMRGTHGRRCGAAVRLWREPRVMGVQVDRVGFVLLSTAAGGGALCCVAHGTPSRSAPFTETVREGTSAGEWPRSDR
mmetsp:Transcript_37787/g.102245  ORF Transcript_37787/g.102245 Transcript_37787/m.102245 type:complete len:262 (-) Transcript_37787:16-801(-)